MAKTITLKISGNEFKADEGSTILDVARVNGIFIPTLCSFKGLSNVGACRLCMVEIHGVPRLQAACSTRVAEGMEITVDSPKLLRYRQMIVELLLAERNHVCAACVANGRCELQSLAQQLGVTHTRYSYRYPVLRVDASHPKFNYDPNRCVLCTRCLRVCEEVEGARTWNVMGRHQRADGLRPRSALGAGAKLHLVRKMRSGLPDRRAQRKRLRRRRARCAR